MLLGARWGDTAMPQPYLLTGAELWTGSVLVHDAVCCTPLRVRQMLGILGF